MFAAFADRKLYSYIMQKKALKEIILKGTTSQKKF